MSTTRTLVLATLALVLALSAACAGEQGPVVTEAEIAAAEQSGNLADLYESLSTQLSTLKPGSEQAAELRTALLRIGGDLSKNLKAEVQTELDAVPRTDGLIPVGAIENAITRIAPMERWSPSTFQSTKAELEAELKKTQDGIAQREKQVAEMTGDDQVLERLRMLDQLTTLTGSGSPEEAKYAQQREQILRDLSQDAAKAIEAEDYEKAQNLLKIVEEVKPDDEALQAQLVEVDTKVFERKFWAALEQGNPDKAIELLTEISETKSFDEIRKNLADSAKPMADHYAELGAEATAAGNLAAAYQRYLDSMKVSKLLLDKNEPPKNVEPFLKAIQKRYEAALADGDPGRAWGYLEVTAELGPMTPQLRRSLRETRDKVLDRAVKRLGAFPFEDPERAESEVGEAVASKVIQYLFQEIPNDVRILEREQLERLKTEETIEAGTMTLSAADYIIQGKIVEAKVDTTEKTGKRTMRVVTEKQSKPNPKHTWWMGLDKDERAKYDEPPQFISVDVKEDVSIGETLIRKVGILSVSYNIVDAKTSRVLFTDTIRDKKEFQDKSTEGVELGDFKMPFKLAELPSDIEILSGLADAASDEIGKKLADFLRDPEDDYAETAERFVKEGNYAGATQQFAYAAVLSARKDKPTDELLREMRLYAVESGR